MENNQLTTSANAIQVDGELQQRFITLCQEANQLQLADNVSETFKAAAVVQALRELLTQRVVEKFFVPLMGTRIGFLTDHDKEGKDGKRPSPYDWQTVRDCIIDLRTKSMRPAMSPSALK